MESDNERAKQNHGTRTAEQRQVGFLGLGKERIAWGLPSVTLGTALCSIFIASCATPPAAPVDWQGQLDDMTASAVNAAMSVGRAESAEAAVRPGYLEGVLLARSELEYVLRRSSGEEDAEHWLLRVRAPEMPTKPRGGWISMSTQPEGEPKRFVHRRAQPYRGTLTILRKGKEEAENGLVLPLAFFGTSLFDACGLAQTTSMEELARAGRTGEADDPEAAARATFTAMALAAGRNPAVETILKETVTWPKSGFFSDPDIAFGMETDIFAAKPVTTQFGPGYRLAVQFEINGESAFFGNFTVVEPRGSLLMTGGVVEVVGYAPSAPDQRVHLALAGGAMPKTGRLDANGVAKLLAIHPELRVETEVIGAQKGEDR